MSLTSDKVGYNTEHEHYFSCYILDQFTANMKIKMKTTFLLAHRLQLGIVRNSAWACQ